jgi:FKBP-type peptidyl-prolyl cis-trans isomerase 2
MALKTYALLSAVIALLVLSSGCIGGDDDPDVKIDLTLMGEDGQNVVQGNNTSFMFVIENNWKENATLIMDIGKVPNDWDVEFIPERAVLEKHTGIAVRMNVSLSSDAFLQRKDLNVKVRAQGSDVHKKELTVTVFPQSDTIGHSLKVVTPGGDTTYVNYTGYLLNGQVFDTTYEDIGISESVEKTPDYQPRSTWDPQPFHPGRGELVAGFEAGWTNMRQGEYKSFFVHEEDAYSVYEESTRNLTEAFPLREEWSSNEFERAFREEPTMWLLVTHRQWNWTAQVVFIADDEDKTVTLELRVSPGDTTDTFGWDSEVISVDSTANGGVGEFILHHNPGQVGDIAQIYNRTAPVEYDFGEVIEVTDDTVSVRIQTSHHPLAGEHLIFWVKIHEFQSPNPT